MRLKRRAPPPPRLLPLLPLLALGACGVLPPTCLSAIHVRADADANIQNAVALDIVFVYDKTLLAKLPPTAPAWFSDGPALLADAPGALAVAHVELVPGGATELALPPGYAKAIGVYSYPNYLPAPAQQRRNLTPYRDLTIRLGSQEVSYIGPNPCSSF